MKNLPFLLLLVFCGCPSADPPQQTVGPTESAEVKPIELSPDHDTAVVEALKPAVAAGVAEAINQFFEGLYEGLGIEGDADFKLIESAFENMKEQRSTLSITVHGNQYSKAESRNVTVSGQPFIQLSRIPCAGNETYAIVTQYVDTIPVKIFRLNLVDNQNWQYTDIEISTKDIDSE